MSQKVFRTKAQRTASRRDFKHSKKKKDRKSHSAPLFILGGGFLALGIVQAIDPIPFHSGGGYSKGYGSGTVIYNATQSSGFGVFFGLLGLVFLYWGYRIIQNAKPH